MQKTKEKTLLSHVVELLRTRPRTVTLEQISDEIGVSVSWLQSILAGRITEPSVNSVESLYEYLTGKPLSF